MNGMIIGSHHWHITKMCKYSMKLMLQRSFCRACHRELLGAVRRHLLSNLRQVDVSYNAHVGDHEKRAERETRRLMWPCTWAGEGGGSQMAALAPSEWGSKRRTPGKNKRLQTYNIVKQLTRCQDWTWSVFRLPQNSPVISSVRGSRSMS